MNLQERLDAIRNHFDPQVKHLAVVLTNIKTELEEGKLTRDEFTELITDVEDLRRVINLSDDLLTIAAIRGSIDDVIDLAKAVNIL